MAEKKVVRYKLVRHKWPDEIQAERRRRNQIIGVVIACLLCFSGGYFTNEIFGQKAIAKDATFSKLADIYTVMNSSFYFGKDKKDFSEKLVNGAIEGMVNAGGDSHTMYLSPSETKNFTSTMEGSYTGIGIQFYSDDNNTIIISKVFPDSPAQKAELIEGDQIFSVNGNECKGMDSEKVRSMITGEKQKNITIEILRENKKIKKEMKTEKILSSVFSEIKDKTGIMEISAFADTSGEEVGNHLKRMKEKGCTSLLIDLRDNPGGYVYAAQQIASYLLPKDTVVYNEINKFGDKKSIQTLDDYERYSFKKVVILVNEGTASAAEILSAALNEQIGAEIVGTKSYGKGTVQLPQTFADGSMFKYTTNEWTSSKGNKINGKGITPTYIVSNDPALSLRAPKLEKDEVFKGDSVSVAAKSVQTMLRFLGYKVDREDEYFSPTSSNSLKEYQKSKGLSVSGEINNTVIESLLSSCSVQLHANEEAYDVVMKKGLELANGK
ncbi:MAG: S41 family peptidase [Longicatena sp.]